VPDVTVRSRSGGRYLAPARMASFTRKAEPPGRGET